MTMVLVMPMAATTRLMAPRPPSIICFCRASFSMGSRMLSMDSVAQPRARMRFSSAATWEMLFAFTSTDW